MSALPDFHRSYIPESITELAIAQLVQTDRHASRSEIVTRVQAARAFIERAGLEIRNEWQFMDLEQAMFRAATHMAHGSELMSLALDIGLLRRLCAESQQVAV